MMTFHDLQVNKTLSQYIEKLKANAIEHDGLMHWCRELKLQRSTDSPSIKVEIAAYSIMAMVEANLVTDAVPIMKWLMTQRTDTGGFYSTTDTVVGIEALALMAENLYNGKEMNLEVKLNDKRIFRIDKENALVLQSGKLAPNKHSVRCNVIGNGTAFVQIASSYNTLVKEPVTKFHLTAVDISKSPERLDVKICTAFIPEEGKNTTSMTLIEINLPSGFEYDKETSDLAFSAVVRVNIYSYSHEKTLNFNLTF